MYDELTREDIQKMQEELDYRITVIRNDLHEKIMQAKEWGDFSENAEYHEARRAKGRNESRIEYLQNMIKTAKIVESKQNSDCIGMNSKVEVIYDDDGSTETYEITSTVGQDAINNKISKDSPFGQAVWGKKAGDKVLVKVNDSVSYYVTIKSVNWQINKIYRLLVVQRCHTWNGVKAFACTHFEWCESKISVCILGFPPKKNTQLLFGVSLWKVIPTADSEVLLWRKSHSINKSNLKIFLNFVKLYKIIWQSYTIYTKMQVILKGEREKWKNSNY